MAQPTPQDADTTEDVISPPAAVTAESVEQLRQQVTSASDIDEELKKSVLDMLQKATDAIGRAVKLEAAKPMDQAAVEAIATKAKDLQTILSGPAAKPLEDLAEDASLPDLMSALATHKPALQESRTKLATLEAEPDRRADRRATIARDLITHANDRAAAEKDLAALAPADESPYLTAARRAALMARMREVTAQAPAWQAEISRYDAEKAVDLSALRIQVAKKEVAKLQQEVDELTKRITSRRSMDARYIVEQLNLFANGTEATSPYNHASPPLDAGPLTSEADIETATETARLADINLHVTSQLTTATNDLNAASSQLEQLRALKSKTNKSIARVGLTGAIGLELRRYLRNLADSSEIKQRCRDRQDLMRDVEFKRLDLEDAAPTFADRADEILRNESPGRELELRLAKDRLTTITTLEKNYGELFNRQGELDTTEQELIREIDEFDTFIRERVLWIRSHPFPSLEDFVDFAQTATWLILPQRWSSVGNALQTDILKSTWLYVLITILAVLLFGVQKRLQRNLASIAESSSKPTCREFEPTVRASMLTVVLSLAWPAIPAFLGWRLVAINAEPFVHAVGHGFLAVTAGVLTLNLLRQICRPSGLGRSHFFWPSNVVTPVRQQLQTLLYLLLPLLFVERLLHSLEVLQGRDALERTVFILSLLVLVHFQVKVLHPTTGVFRAYFVKNATGWAHRFRWPVYLLIVVAPVTLALLAVFGFYYTAYELSWRLHLTTWAMIGLFIVRSFLMRWYVVRHRELRIQQARKRRQALNEAAQQSSEGSTLPQAPPADAPVDLQEVSEQTQRLIDSALGIVGLVMTWFVWVNVLPALGVLDRWELWPTVTDVTVAYSDEEGVQKFRVEQRPDSVTVADLLIGIVIALLTFTAARNIPGLLEITVLNRLPLDAATRYAARMIGRYFIFVVGMVLAFGAIGIGWAQVQWLAAGLTLGLAFGLQEIFANFISGLIILFERPVRINDVVTIGDVSGTVSRIHIRATTIIDWDRKEYIVPNKEFVTGRLLNWTLSDQTNRVLIDVGVAYGTDTAFARSLLLKVADQHQEVMDDPAPIATMEGFGDSTLNLRLRCYLPSLENRLTTITELHEAIDAEFQQADIEISFPQRDLHVRSFPTVATAAELDGNRDV